MTDLEKFLEDNIQTTGETIRKLDVLLEEPASDEVMVFSRELYTVARLNQFDKLQTLCEALSLIPKPLPRNNWSLKKEDIHFEHL